MKYLPKKLAKFFSQATGKSLMRFYDPPLDIVKNKSKIRAIQRFDREAREDGSMLDIRNKYMATVPEADSFISITNTWDWDKDLIESYGGEYAVYEECLRRNITWEKLVNAEQYNEKVLQEIEKKGGFSKYVL